MTLADLRPDMADMLEAIGHPPAGVAALRWAAARDPDGLGERGLEIDQLEERLEAYETLADKIRGLVDGQTRKRPDLTPAKFRDAVRDALSEVD
jgi:hypothetical protein